MKVDPIQLIYSAYNQFFLWDNSFVPKTLLEKRPNLALYFKLDFSIDNYGFEKDGNTRHKEWKRSFRKILHVIVTTQHRVYTLTTDDLKEDSFNKASEWKNISNHDFCWHSDGLNDIQDVFMEGYEYCWGHVPEEHRDTPAAAWHFCHFGGSGWLTPEYLSFVEVIRRPTTKKERQERGVDDNYLDKLKSIKPVRFSINFE
jgi:hypothetical protein